MRMDKNVINNNIKVPIKNIIYTYFQLKLFNFNTILRYNLQNVKNWYM